MLRVQIYCLVLIVCLFPEHGAPTSVAFVTTDPNQVVVSFDGGETLLYDLNTEQSVTVLETQTKDGTFSVMTASHHLLKEEFRPDL